MSRVDGLQGPASVVRRGVLGYTCCGENMESRDTDGAMTDRRPQWALDPSDDDMTRAERRINWIAWFGGLAVVLVTGGSLALILDSRSLTPSEYGILAALGGVPLAYGLLGNLVIRQMHVSLLHRYQAQLLGHLTDLKELVYRDELTGLYNRRHFYEALQAEVSRAHRTKEPLALLLLDLDKLKGINDEYGHRVGDAVLAGIGKTIEGHVRAHDVAARLGGDEFGVIMPSTDKRGAFALARRLWDELERTPMHEEDGRRVMVTVSIGLGGFPWGGESAEEMIQWADADMYANKVSGKLPRQPVSAEAGAASGSIDDPWGDTWGEM